MTHPTVEPAPCPVPTDSQPVEPRPDVPRSPTPDILDAFVLFGLILNAGRVREDE